METGPGHDVYVVNGTSADGDEPIGCLTTAGRQNDSGVLMLLRSIRHGILANTKIDRPQNLERAAKNKNKSCNAPKSQIPASNRSCK